MQQYKITLVRSGVSFYFDNSTTLLNAIMQQGVNPDWGCKAGFCGSCRATVLSGKWHYAADPIAFVKTDQILLCCATVDSDLELDV